MTDQVTNSVIQIFGTLGVGIIAAGSAIFSQHLASSRAHKAKMAELEYQSEARRKRIQTNTLISIQRVSNSFVSSVLGLLAIKLRAKQDRGIGLDVKSRITDASTNRRKLAALTERVLDDELRVRLKKLVARADEYVQKDITPLTPEQAKQEVDPEVALKALDEVNQSANLRLGEILRQMI